MFFEGLDSRIQILDLEIKTLRSFIRIDVRGLMIQLMLLVCEGYLISRSEANWITHQSFGFICGMCFYSIYNLFQYRNELKHALRIKALFSEGIKDISDMVKIEQAKTKIEAKLSGFGIGDLNKG